MFDGGKLCAVGCDDLGCAPVEGPDFLVVWSVGNGPYASASDMIGIGGAVGEDEEGCGWEVDFVRLDGGLGVEESRGMLGW